MLYAAIQYTKISVLKVMQLTENCSRY